MTQTNEPRFKLRILKSWITKDPSLVLQFNPMSNIPTLNLPKKAHLILDLRQQHFGFRIEIDKPSSADANHAFIQILRKQMPNFTIKAIFQDENDSRVWIPLLGGGLDSSQTWSLVLTPSKPPIISLIAPDETIHVSFGQKGTFTKKHQAPARPDIFNLPDVLPKMLASAFKAVDSSYLPSKIIDTVSTNPSLPPISKLQKELLERLKRKLKTSRKTLEKISKDLPLDSEVSRQQIEANLLQNFAWLVREQAFELKLDPGLTGLKEEILIELDPELSVGQNIEKKFTQLNKSRRGFEIGKKQLLQTESQLLSLQTDIEDLRTTSKSPVELEHLICRYRLPELQKLNFTGHQEAASKPYKSYQSSSGHQILVGKTAIDNDELCKSARANDYWIHAVGVTGSHVIVPVTSDIRSALPTALLKEAAILALYFSKLREDLSGECYITRKMYLKKQRGMAAGLWRIDKSETMFFRYMDSELQAILKTVRV